MASQIIPLTELDKAGVIKDTPSVALPPNVFTDVRNMRFRHGAIRKMEGDSPLGLPGTKIQFIAYWPNPNLTNDGYWIYVDRNADSEDEVFLLKASDTDNPHKVYTFGKFGTYQHTLFQGGFVFILNNGVDRPIYMLDKEGNTDITAIEAAILPGWDSYIVNETAVDAEYTSGSSYLFDLGQLIDWKQSQIEVTRTRGTNDPVTFADTDVAGDSGTPGDTDYVPANLPDDPTRPGASKYAIYTDTETNTTVLHIGQGLAARDVLEINIQSRNEVNVRAGVIRSFGDLLVAGDLTEFIGDNTIRRLAGVVRTSDVAQAGAMPNNWNPFFDGASTADEFTLSGTGRIRDMVELQGRMMVYTNDSIHALTLTGQSAAPVSFQPITRQYGAMTLNSVQEYDGKHLVVGSQDIYLFGGHPSNIQSVAEGRVRDYFYDRLDSSSESLKAFDIVRNQGKDELWLCYKIADTDAGEALVFNYRMNTWTIRDIPAWQNITDAPLGGKDPNVVHPVFANDSDVWQSDIDTSFLPCHLERRVAPISPEFNTESIMGMALWTQGDTEVELTIDYVGSNTPSDTDAEYTGQSTFSVKDDYKTDIRMNGRFMNFKISDTGDKPWNLSGIQLEVSQGGKR